MSEVELRYAICKLEERIAQLERDSIKVGDVIRTESHIHEDIWQVNELHITDREKGTEWQERNTSTLPMP